MTEPIMSCKSNFQPISSIVNVNIIIAAGVNASKERATDSGTASGILILNPVVVVRR